MPLTKPSASPRLFHLPPEPSRAVVFLGSQQLTVREIVHHFEFGVVVGRRARSREESQGWWRKRNSELWVAVLLFSMPLYVQVCGWCDGPSLVSNLGLSEAVFVGKRSHADNTLSTA